MQNVLAALKARNALQCQSLVPDYLIFLLIGDIYADHAHKPCDFSLHIGLNKFYYKHSNQIQDLSKYTVPTSLVGMSLPTTVVGMLVVSALPTKVVGMLYVIFSIKYKKKVKMTATAVYGRAESRNL